MNNKDINKESFINDLTVTAIELVNNTDWEDINDIENAHSTIQIDDRYEVNISIDCSKFSKNVLTDWWIWFTLFDDGYPNNAIEQDSENLLDDKIREAATAFVGLCEKLNIITT